MALARLLEQRHQLSAICSALLHDMRQKLSHRVVNLQPTIVKVVTYLKLIGAILLISDVSRDNGDEWRQAGGE